MKNSRPHISCKPITFLNSGVKVFWLIAFVLGLKNALWQPLPASGTITGEAASGSWIVLKWLVELNFKNDDKGASAFSNIQSDKFFTVGTSHEVITFGVSGNSSSATANHLGRSLLNLNIGHYARMYQRQSYILEPSKRAFSLSLSKYCK
jgi:hypothetical protein